MRHNVFRQIISLIHKGMALLLLVLLVISSLLSQVRRDIEVSTYFQPFQPKVSPGSGKRFFRGAFRVAGAPLFGKSFEQAGGVVPGQGDVQFWSPGEKKNQLSTKQMQFVILDREKIQNSKVDYDAVGIRWQGHVYRIEMQDDLVLPLMKFIARDKVSHTVRGKKIWEDRYIAYTIPFNRYDEMYFRRHSLRFFRAKEWRERDINVKGDGYVAEEFLSPPHAELLEKTDFAKTEEFPSQSETKGGEKDAINALLLQFLYSGEVFQDMEPGDGTYVNADFDVTYQVFFEERENKRVIDVGGLPLRYHWAINEKKQLMLWHVDKFQFPEEVHSDQDKSIMLFQTAAILRQFKKNNRIEFGRFQKQLEDLIEPKANPTN